MRLLSWLARWRSQGNGVSCGRQFALVSGERFRPRQCRRPLGLESLELRLVLAEDFGDAPDTGAGTGPRNYETLLANGGPRHTIVPGASLQLGQGADGEGDAAQSALANGDDTAQPDFTIGDDEDGVVNPQVDLQLTIGAQPTVTLWATNRTLANATLSGWIDYNSNGVFENSTERAQVVVGTGITEGRFTLTFPVVPTGFTGTTFARFRLSTDVAATNPTGAAMDGEVEDYAVTITRPSNGTVKPGGATKIASGTGGGPTLANQDRFGRAVANIGDLDGDGVADLAVGAIGDSTNGANRGAVHILFMNTSGTVKSSTKIASGSGGGPTLANSDYFGFSVANMGDLDGDGVTDLAVGARSDDTGGSARGAVYILFLNANGTSKGSTKIASGLNGGPTLANGDAFGTSVANIGDLNGDGLADLAVGADSDDTGGAYSSRGAVHILFLNDLNFGSLPIGGVKSSTKIASGSGGGPALADQDYFGRSVASVGDLDGDGVTDLAVGATGDDTGGGPDTNRGAAHIMFLKTDGTAKSSAKIASGTGGGPSLAEQDSFGRSVANVGDLDGDGVTDLAVGATGDDNRGAVHFLSLKADGTAKSSTRIASDTGGGPTLASGDDFGRGVATIGDLDGDGVADLAVGASADDTGGNSRGAVHILKLNAGNLLRDFGDAPDTSAGTGARNYQTLLSDSGPSHGIVSGLLLGTRISGETDAAPNSLSNGDDTASDDEDGVVNTLVDFRLTAGSQPTITLRASNATGSIATLSGWIDYNSNGVFDNASERAQVIVPAGTSNNTFTLTFPVVPMGFTGTTYARFRLSSDPAGSNPTGGATDGEIEDYAVTITRTSSGMVKSGGATKIASGTGGGPTLAPGDNFGISVAHIESSSQAGAVLLAVGASGDDTGTGGGAGFNRGAVHILSVDSFGNANPSSKKVAHETNGGPTLANQDSFGDSVANIGDLDGDGVADLAVGATGDDTGGGPNTNRGAVHILFLKSDSTVKSSTKIASGTGGGPTLTTNDYFGGSITSLGDLDGDGVTDLAVGATGDNTGGTDRGAVHILFLKSDGTVKLSAKIASGIGGGPILVDRDYFGRAVANVGDMDGDGVTDLAVGANGDQSANVYSIDRGAVHILFLKSDGTVKSSTKITSGVGGGPTLADYDSFGRSVANVGDLNGDGVADLAVGADGDDLGGNARGAAHILLLNANGTVQSSTKIASGTGGGPTLANDEQFSRSVASVGDLDGDGIVNLAVGASPLGSGSVHILRLSPPPLTLSANTIAENSASGTVIGTFTSTDPDAGNTFTYSLLNPGVNVDNQAFSIVGNQLRSFAVFDFEAKSTYSVVVRTTDQGGLFFDRTFTVNITDVNESVPNSPPTGLALSANTIPENSVSGTAIGTFSTTDPDAGNTFTYSLVSPQTNVDNQAFSIVGNQLRSFAVFNFEAKSSYSVVIRTTDQGNLSFDQTFTINIGDINENGGAGNTAPVLDASGNPFAILGAGSRQSTEMRQGMLVSDILARAAANVITDVDAGALRGIALTAVDQSLGNFQYTLVTNNPLESDWTNVDAAGAVSNSNALLLPTNARLRFTTGRIPHHDSAAFFLNVESKLDTGLTFRAWDRNTGVAGGRGDASANGGTSAFSAATETVKVYFEVRLFRSFNPNASLNVYTLEAEFNALTSGAFQDRSTDAFTGFTVLLSAVPELGTSALFRLYFGIQFNDNGTETDMGYRYLTSNGAEATFLESIGPASKRPQREGTYFRELGVSNGTATIGYVFDTQQPGTSQLTQIYRTDVVNKPTRPPGTSEGGTPTSFKPQENGDHVYTTNTAFESTKLGTWRIESTRGFVRPLGGSGIIAPASSAGATPVGATSSPVVRAAATINVSPTVPLFQAGVTGSVVTAILPTSLATTPAVPNPDHVSTTVDVGLIAPPIPATQQVVANAPANPETTEPIPKVTSELVEERSATDDLFASLGNTSGDLCPW
jgi:hypothetical protein